MKRVTILMIVMLLLANELSAASYKILRINTKSILIGGKSRTTGAFFEDNEPIEWKDDNQFMQAQNQENGRTYFFTKEAMQSKNSRSVYSYLYQSAKLSTKSDYNWQTLKGENKSNFSEKRIALVIGNANYEHANPLRNTLNDATEISRALKNLGFDVLCLYDGTKEAMNQILDAFIKQAVEGGYQMAMCYYSGHGLQYKQNNYLLPVDARLNSPGDVNNCIDGNWMLNKVVDTKCENTIVVLDACRNEKTNWTRGLENGLATVEPPKGMCLVYSTSSGEFAQDLVKEDDTRGPFAIALVEALKKESLTVDDVFSKEVKSRVLELTANNQLPTISNKLLNTRLCINGKNDYPGGPQNFEMDDLAKAMRGDKNAQFRMGYNYQYGLNNYEQNDNEAVQWYVRAAKQGHAEANNMLGYYYFQLKNYNKARDMFLEAAQAGSVNAQYNIGNMLVHKEFGVESPKEGVRWLLKAAEAGNVDAQYELGKCYYEGIGVSPYLADAMKWFAKAAAQDHADACYSLGLCYYYHYHNYPEAVKWFTKAAEKDNPDAQFKLCDCYRRGKGVEQDIVLAKEWCKRAANLGDERAKRFVDESNNGFRY